MHATLDTQRRVLVYQQRALCTYAADSQDPSLIYVSTPSYALLQILRVGVRDTTILVDDASVVSTQTFIARPLPAAALTDGVYRVLGCDTANPGTLLVRRDRLAMPEWVAVNRVQEREIRRSIRDRYNCSVPVLTTVGEHQYQGELPVAELIYQHRTEPVGGQPTQGAWRRHTADQTPGTWYQRAPPVFVYNDKLLIVHSERGVLFYAVRDNATRKFKLTYERAALFWEARRHCFDSKITGISPAILGDIQVVSPQFTALRLRYPDVELWPMVSRQIRLLRLGTYSNVPPPERVFAAAILRTHATWVVVSDARWQEIHSVRLWVVPEHLVRSRRALRGVLPVIDTLDRLPLPFMMADIVPDQSSPTWRMLQVHISHS